MRFRLCPQIVRAFVALCLSFAGWQAAMAESAPPPPRVTVAKPIAKTIDVWCRRGSGWN